MLTILCALAAGIVLGFFVPLWVATLLTICWFAWLVWMYTLSYRGLTPAGYVFMSSLIFGLFSLVPMWAVYIFRYFVR